MKQVVLFISIFISLNTMATYKVVAIDMNKNGKNDRLDSYSKSGHLIKVELDRNEDGKFDVVREYDGKGSSHWERELIDQNYDGYFERRKFIETFIGKEQVLITEVDRNKDQKFEIRYVRLLKNRQKAEENKHLCYHQYISLEIQKLNSVALQVYPQVNNGIFQTDFGFDVDHACLERYGENFFSYLKDSMLEGLKCLEGLGQSDKINMATENGYELAKQINSERTTIGCSETNEFRQTGDEWGFDDVGEASIGREGENASLNIRGVHYPHPYISMSPYQKDTSAKLLIKTLFHEKFHNIGHAHGTGFEVSYSCEECCFDSEDKESSCRMCAGDYIGPEDPLYMEDSIKLGRKLRNYHIAMVAVDNFLDEVPGSRTGIFSLANISGSVSNPTGPYLAKLLKERFPPEKMNKQEKEYLEHAQRHTGAEHFKGSEKIAMRLAQAKLFYYYDQDPNKAFDQLKEVEQELISYRASYADFDVDEYGFDLAKYRLIEDYRVTLINIYFNDKIDFSNKTKAEKVYKRLFP